MNRLGAFTATPSLLSVFILTISALTLSDTEHLGTTRRACSLSRRLTVLHRYGFRIFHVPFGTAFYTVRLHSHHPLFAMKIKHSGLKCQ